MDVSKAGVRDGKRIRTQRQAVQEEHPGVCGGCPADKTCFDLLDYYARTGDCAALGIANRAGEGRLIVLRHQNWRDTREKNDGESVFAHFGLHARNADCPKSSLKVDDGAKYRKVRSPRPCVPLWRNASAVLPHPQIYRAIMVRVRWPNIRYRPCAPCLRVRTSLLYRPAALSSHHRSGPWNACSIQPQVCSGKKDMPPPLRAKSHPRWGSSRHRSTITSPARKTCSISFVLHHSNNCEPMCRARLAKCMIR